MADEREAEPPKLIQRLRARQESHRQQGVIYRAAFVVAGATLLLAGIAMLVLPGPALVVIPIGLAILALEFAWADNLLDEALRRADAAQRKAAEASRRDKILSAIATVLAIGAFVAAWLTWDIPVIPG